MSELESIKENVTRIAGDIAKSRDELSTALCQFNQLLDSCVDAGYELKFAAQNIQKAIDGISETV